MLSRFTVVLLDMNGTFMFGGDRFGPEQDYAATYRRLGGGSLTARVVHDGVLACFNELGVIYEDPSRCDSFPGVLDTLRVLPLTRDLPDSELERLEHVIAEHELGTVSDDAGSKSSSELVSSIFSRPPFFPLTVAASSRHANSLTKRSAP